MKNNVTIIIPTYNSENTIEKAILSVLNNNSAIRIIIIDDNSKDKTFDKCKKIKEKFPKQIECYKNDKNGVGSARNKGIEKVKTEYIDVFADSDGVTFDVCVNGTIYQTRWQGFCTDGAGHR